MTSKTPNIATIGCMVVGCLTFIVGIPWSYLGALTRVYSPDSTRASFKSDSCHTGLGLPTCALWLPDKNAFVLIGIVAASMSTCDGAILAMGTVFSHNIVRNLGSIIPGFPKKVIHEKNLLLWARIVSVPFTIAAMLIAIIYKPMHSLGVGYLLVVAFDIVLASVVVLLFFWMLLHRQPITSFAAFCAIIVGATVHVILEFAFCQRMAADACTIPGARIRRFMERRPRRSSLPLSTKTRPYTGTQLQRHAKRRGSKTGLE
ncbi:hypothetical protein ACHAWF_005921 [Thalassiosira exigua]